MMRLPYCQTEFPRTVAEAVALKESHGTAGAYLAGGTDLLPNMKRRQQTPTRLIDIRRIEELNRLETTPDGSLLLGAGVTLSALIRSQLVRDGWPVIADAAATISTPILQNMGTLGGNLLLDTRCNYYDQSYEWRKAIDFCMKKDGSICWVAPSSPRCWAVQSSDLVPVMVALGATVQLVGPDGSRTLPIGELYHNDGIAYHTKRADELLVSVVVPPQDGAKSSYQKLRRRGSFDFPVLGVAAWVREDQGKVADARIVLGAVGSYPIESKEAAEVLIGGPLDDDTVDRAALAAAKPAKPLDNTDFTIGWRKDMVSVYVRRALDAVR